MDREIKDIKDNLTLSVQLYSSNGNIFRNGDISTNFEAKVFRGANDITSTLPPGSYAWQRVSNNPEEDEVWNAAHADAGTAIELTGDDIYGKAIIGFKVYEDALPAPEN